MHLVKLAIFILVFMVAHRCVMRLPMVYQMIQVLAKNLQYVMKPFWQSLIPTASRIP